MMRIPFVLAMSLPWTLVAPGSPVVSSQTQLRSEIAGRRPGTERWLVTFKRRSFDLTEFRAANAGPATPADVASIVAGLERKMRVDQAEFVKFIQGLGGVVTSQWWLINGCAIEIPAGVVARVAANPRVQRMDPDLVVRPVGFLPIKDATNLQNHRVDALQAAGVRGKGVTVAVMDTGLDSPMQNSGRPHRTFFVHGDVNNKTGGGIGGSRLISNKTYTALGPDDVNQHGTGVAGIAVGEDWGTATSDRGHAPSASVAGYCIAESVSGNTRLSVIVNAWTAIAADAKKLGIVVANNSYSGVPDPRNPSQQALDSVALNAGVLPVVAAGNNASSTVNSQSAANGLAVAAVSGRGAKTVARFSSRGPLRGDSQRTYPDISANGVQTVMPLRNDESGSFVASGTSMASPQVAGAAALFRSVRRSTVLETKAALLTTTEDISNRNKTAPFNSRNAYGMGYLRDDTLVRLAKGSGVIQSGTLTVAQKSKTLTMAVVQGKRYAVTIAWFRHSLTTANWSNLDLEVKVNNVVVGRSKSPRNLYEKVVFTAPSSGQARLAVTGVTLEIAQVGFALAATQLPPPYAQGSLTPFGKACLGSGPRTTVDFVVPAAYAKKFGLLFDQLGPGGAPHRAQTIYDSKGIARSFRATGIAWRRASRVLTHSTGSVIEMRVDLGSTTVAPKAIGFSFASNRSRALTTVVPRQRIRLPVFPRGKNTNVADFPFQIPFSKPWTFVKKPNEHLIVETWKFSTTSPILDLNVRTDAAFSFRDRPASRVWARSPFATRAAGRSNGFGAVLGFTERQSIGVMPTLVGSGTPDAGATYGLAVDRAAERAPLAWILGVSNRMWGAIPLPLSLPGKCALLCSMDILKAGQVDFGGGATTTFGLPNVTSLIGLGFYHQALIVDPKANALGVVLTNGLTGRIGGQR